MQMRPQFSGPSVALGQVPLPGDVKVVGRGGEGLCRNLSLGGPRCEPSTEDTGSAWWQVPAIIILDSSEMDPITPWCPIPDTLLCDLVIGAHLKQSVPPHCSVHCFRSRSRSPYVTSYNMRTNFLLYLDSSWGNVFIAPWEFLSQD